VPEAFYNLYPTDRLPEVKLHPNTGDQRHPWVEKQDAMMDSEAKFHDAEERLRAMASYYGLCTWLDHNIGALLSALEAAGFGDNTTVIYTSDHGDNVGARGLWGKSNLYQESVSVPLIMAGPDVPVGICDTPVSLLDISATIPDHFGLPFESDGRSLTQIAGDPPDPDRAILSQYHAAGAVSGAFMLRKGRWKLNWYVGFEPELFDMHADPEETKNLARLAEHSGTLNMMEAALREQIDPETANDLAFSDQAALVASYGGREAALKLGAPAATPPPEVSSWN